MRRLFLAAVLLLASTSFLVGCSTSSPDGAAKDWVNALASGDGSKLSELTVQEARGQVAASSMMLGGLGSLSGTKVNTDELKYQTTRNDGNAADVQVTGTLRVTVLGMTQPQNANFVMHMRKEGDKWLYTGQ